MSVQCEGPASIIVIVREDIEGAISEGPSSGELAYDEGEPADDSPLGEIVWRRDLSASWCGWSLPVGPLPSCGREDGGKFRAWRKYSFSSSSSATRCSKACKVLGVRHIMRTKQESTS